MKGRGGRAVLIMVVVVLAAGVGLAGWRAGAERTAAASAQARADTARMEAELARRQRDRAVHDVVVLRDSVVVITRERDEARVASRAAGRTVDRLLAQARERAPDSTTAARVDTLRVAVQTERAEHERAHERCSLALATCARAGVAADSALAAEGRRADAGWTAASEWERAYRAERRAGRWRAVKHVSIGVASGVALKTAADVLVALTRKDR